jgi:hypothetical protein
VEKSRGDSLVIEAYMLQMGDMDGLNSSPGHSVVPTEDRSGP